MCRNLAPNPWTVRFLCLETPPTTNHLQTLLWTLQIALNENLSIETKNYYDDGFDSLDDEDHLQDPSNLLFAGLSCSSDESGTQPASRRAKSNKSKDRTGPSGVKTMKDRRKRK